MPMLGFAFSAQHFRATPFYCIVVTTTLYTARHYTKFIHPCLQSLGPGAVMDSLRMFGLSYSSMEMDRWRLGRPWLSTDDLLSTPGRVTLVSQPRPLQKSRIALANLIGASSKTSATSSIFRRLVRVLSMAWCMVSAEETCPDFAPATSSASHRRFLDRRTVTSVRLRNASMYCFMFLGLTVRLTFSR